jgi:hypothetical protein
MPVSKTGLVWRRLCHIRHRRQAPRSTKLEGLWIGLPIDAVDDIKANDEDNYHITSNAAMARLGLNLHF